MIIESGKVLAIRRKTLNLTQEKLADILDVDVTSVQNWEAGKRVGIQNRKLLYDTLLLNQFLESNDFNTMIENGAVEIEYILSYDDLAKDEIRCGQLIREYEKKIDMLTMEVEELRKCRDFIQESVASMAKRFQEKEHTLEEQLEVHKSLRIQAETQLEQVREEYLKYRKAHEKDTNR